MGVGAQHGRVGGNGAAGVGGTIQGAGGNGAVGLGGSDVGMAREMGRYYSAPPSALISTLSAPNPPAPTAPPTPAPFIPTPPHSSSPRPIHLRPAPFIPAPPHSSPLGPCPRLLIGFSSHQSARSGSSHPAPSGLSALLRKHVIEWRMRAAITGTTWSGGACAVQVPEWAGGAPRPMAVFPLSPRPPPSRRAAPRRIACRSPTCSSLP